MSDIPIKLLLEVFAIILVGIGVFVVIAYFAHSAPQTGSDIFSQLGDAIFGTIG